MCAKCARFSTSRSRFSRFALLLLSAKIVSSLQLSNALSSKKKTSLFRLRKKGVRVSFAAGGSRDTLTEQKCVQISLCGTTGVFVTHPSNTRRATGNGCATSVTSRVPTTSPTLRRFLGSARSGSLVTPNPEREKKRCLARSSRAIP